MIAGIHGGLISAAFAEAELPALCDARPSSDVLREADLWGARVETSFGPASSIRAIADGVALPLFRILGFDLIRRHDDLTHSRFDIGRDGASLAPVVIVAWDQSLDSVWRTSVLDAIRADARWVFCVNGRCLRIVDAHRTWSRNTLEFDLAVLAQDEPTLTLLWRVARVEALAVQPPVLDVAADRSARHGVAVCGALAGGVIDALELLLGAFTVNPRRRADRGVLLEQSLTVLYRVLFLLFAEARGLVPVWHPIYRDRYTIDAIVSALLSGRRCRGVWAAITAISRLAHAGCTAGELKVTAFNGRLFAPAGTGTIDRTPIDDAVMAKAVLAVSTTPPARGEVRRRIVYQDLDVEELGAVYEHVLDYEPASGARGALARTRDLRKSTGTFYTPRAITAHLVRDTLAPLLAGRSSEDILRLRVLDPAMGSGAFLVAACAQIADAAEEALVREGRWFRSDVSAADRIALRRDVAQRCLFGVDLNPTAVQVARLSLWLTTLAADKPLTFLDHRLVAGNSLVGASPDDVLRQPPGGGARRRSTTSTTPLFEAIELDPIVRHAAHARIEIANQPDDSAAIVRAKEKALASLTAADGALARHTRLLDLWCASWFWSDGAAPDRSTFAALADVLLDRQSPLPRRFAEPLLAETQRIADAQRFLHWRLAFPEVFHDADGRPRTDAGFDAIIGNPPWDMVRGDSGDAGTRSARRHDARHLIDFVRGSGIYRADAQSHVNRYQLFVERAVQLARPGGRIGFVLPSGTMSDTGCAPLRRLLFDRARVDAITYFDNRRGIFPIHRSLKFLLLTSTAGERTGAITCRFGLSDPEELDRPATSPVTFTRAFLARLSGDDDLAIPEVHREDDVRLLERISARVPALGDSHGWTISFGRELNATDDRDLFVEADGAAQGRPVLEGKSIEPFRVSIGECRFRLREDVRVSVPRRPRLAYRDVASATNRLTLIAAIVPASAVTTHTLFCLKTPLPLDAQHVLCALLNSFVANYLVRFRVNTHVTVNLVSRLRVPRLDPGSRLYRRLSMLAQTLMHSPTVAEEQPEYAELQALVAWAYELSEVEFSHVLSTFPLMSAAVKNRCLARFKSLSS